jgi:hypothetical protein
VFSGVDTTLPPLDTFTPDAGTPASGNPLLD